LHPGPPMTLGAAAAASVRIIVWFRDCQHQVEPDPAEMAARFGAETTVFDWRSDAQWGQCLDHRQNSDHAGTETGLIGSLSREKEHHREEGDDHRKAPKGLHGLAAGSGERLDQSNSCDGTADHPQHRRAPDLIPRRQMRELHLDEVDIVLNAVEVAEDLIGLAQG
jgi:hypothetical protein